MKIKFCGIRRKEDVDFCNTLLPEFMGMILTPGFKRSITAEYAETLVKEKKSCIKAVGVFVDTTSEKVAEISKKAFLDVIQLHGNETAEIIKEVKELTGLPVWKAVRVQNTQDIKNAELLGADKLVLEGYVSGKAGGTGITANWELISKSKPQIPFFLAGGLTPKNLSAAINTVKPYGVDFSSGIETDGIKDYKKMQEIVNIIRGEEYE